MRQLLRVVGSVVAFWAFTSQAVAATTQVKVAMTFAEPTMPGLVQGCPISSMDGLCGSGEVIPFGHATDTVMFGAGVSCGGCDLRTIHLPQGSIVSDEVFSGSSCPGVCGSRGRGGPQFGTLTDTIVGGTGPFSGATGHLSGSVTGAGTAGVAKLSGAIILGS